MGPHQSFNKLPCCGVHAVHVGACVDFDSAWRRLGRNKTARWKGRTTIREVKSAFRYFGCRLKELEEGGSIQRWAHEHARPSGRYLLRVGGHFLVLDRGELVDQYDRKPLEEHKCRTKRVTHAYEIGGVKCAA